MLRNITHLDNLTNRTKVSRVSAVFKVVQLRDNTGPSTIITEFWMRRMMVALMVKILT